MTTLIIITFVVSLILLFLSYYYLNTWIHYGWKIGAACFVLEILVAVWLG